MVLPIIEYASPVWQTADTTKLHEIQRKGLALCIGACGSSGRKTFEVELGVKPLEIRRMDPSLREGPKIVSNVNTALIKTIYSLG